MRYGSPGHPAAAPLVAAEPPLASTLAGDVVMWFPEGVETEVLGPRRSTRLSRI